MHAWSPPGGGPSSGGVRSTHADSPTRRDVAGPHGRAVPATSSAGSVGRGPRPFGDLGQVDAVIARVLAGPGARVDHVLADDGGAEPSAGTRSMTSTTRWYRSGRCAPPCRTASWWCPPPCSPGRACCRWFGAPVGEAVDQPGVAVVGEDHRLVGREHRVEVGVGQPVRVLAGGWRRIRSTTLTTRTRSAAGAPAAGSTAASVSSVGTSPRTPSRRRACRRRCCAQSQIRGRARSAAAAASSRASPPGLLAGDDHVDVVAAAQAVVADRQERVRVRRQVDPDRPRPSCSSRGR